MNKNRICSKIFTFALCVFIIFGATLCSADSSEKKDDNNTEYNSETSDIYNGELKKENQKFRGVWVSSIYNLDYPNSESVGTDSEKLKKSVVNILNDCQAMGLNAVILQVRPTADALYKSDIFPWSKWLTGTEGTAPDNDFDPLEFWVSEAHKRGIELHAWVNPFRVTGAVKKGTDVLSSAAKNSVLKRYPEYIVKYSNSNENESYYINPALPEARQLIIDGALEIVRNYDVDGIHIDDYFYPGSDFDDESEFAEYGSGFSSKDDWRRNNIDTFVKDMNEQLHKEDSSIQFGVSPSGIWANKSAENPLGSDTSGNESYSSAYADTRKWASEGWIDYIAPQIYWSVGQNGSDYKILFDWWCDVVKDSATKLYIGMADYKTIGADASSPFYNGNEIKKQMEMNSDSDIIDGEIHFAYNSIKKSAELENKITVQYSKQETGGSSQSNSQTSAANGDIKVIIDGREITFDQKPVIENSRTLVPMRAIFEALGAEVEWFSETETVVAACGETKITLKIGNNNMYINGDEKVIELDAAPKIMGSRTLVPLRAVSEVFNSNVEWDNNSRTVTITSNKN